MKIGVIGSGVMGSGVAQSLAQSGLQALLLDVRADKLEWAEKEIRNNLRFRSLFGSGEGLEDAEQIMNRIEFGTDNRVLKDVGFVIENATEDWEVKKEIYGTIDGICNRECIFMVNTSCISITKIASVTTRPHNVIGTHFMNPVPVKKTVEVIRGYYTSDECVRAVEELMGRMGKDIIVVNDYPGFVSNRISHLFMNEAAYVVQDQVASPSEVDDIFKKCYGHAMGPLETADLIGLDTVVHSLNVLYESYQDPKFRCCPLLRKMVDAGLYGRKSGRGFYVYE
ncbi:MAG: 3-hydroxyacyl-CoA dehydrogenase family protein [Paenibacillus dendritiformis]|uniref:3-hydroxyacyl-CoA dehydrogenase family protein n=1 Tax=Paenibacillus dendritiformis TaxID=130049 RepID=UPI00143D351B|nr:3-hydroxyacyl-CoA dehydrogenase family protein [Paenibacillus dendritiformis]MDU5143006.1 3-hydroxyacyl-CoA dehydrogenase family protein [Paenibacillus dendritiformis]NKI19661.1 3-hydroxyacyl-CoA dehydrogenase family protein [Paenibacillus dendritiformis]NRF96376.1 3-hydroxyacyl-CoA dehydrogenase family protein [Paenibacillus dendritiformis]GIO74022.1 3-hydroxybutyryl-CoA dehydrogenase [Paenibacillus dendritiformis]